MVLQRNYKNLLKFHVLRDTIVWFSHLLFLFDTDEIFKP